MVSPTLSDFQGPLSLARQLEIVSKFSPVSHAVLWDWSCPQAGQWGQMERTRISLLHGLHRTGESSHGSFLQEWFSSGPVLSQVCRPGAKKRFLSTFSGGSESQFFSTFCPKDSFFLEFLLWAFAGPSLFSQPVLGSKPEMKGRKKTEHWNWLWPHGYQCSFCILSIVFICDFISLWWELSVLGLWCLRWNQKSESFI